MILKLTSLVTLFKSCFSTTNRKIRISSPTKHQIPTYIKPFPPPKPTPTAQELRLKLSALPQELYNEIKLFVLAPNSTIQPISPSYRPPIPLQLSRKHRKTFSAAYYSNLSIFKFQNSTAGILIFGEWIASLSGPLLGLLEEQYGTEDQEVLDDAVDVQLEISGERRLRVWCEIGKYEKWIKVLKVRLYQD